LPSLQRHHFLSRAKASNYRSWRRWPSHSVGPRPPWKRRLNLTLPLMRVSVALTQQRIKVRIVHCRTKHPLLHCTASTRPGHPMRALPPPLTIHLEPTASFRQLVSTRFTGHTCSILTNVQARPRALNTPKLKTFPASPLSASTPRYLPTMLLSLRTRLRKAPSGGSPSSRLSPARRRC